jgi:tripartite ATP-independent transporter DctM subunit
VTYETAIGLTMLAVMIAAIFLGFPISFTLLFLAFAFGWWGLGDVVFNLAYFQSIGLMKESLLAAVPLFIFMGFIAEQAGLLLAPVRGSLFIVVLVTAAAFAMATGIVGAAVTVLGIMAAPIMMRSGYDGQLAAGAITAGGTLGILIPPSVMLIVMGPVLGVSVADLYAAAIVPGFMLAGLYVIYVAVRSFFNPKLGPPLPKEERAPSVWSALGAFAVGVLPLAGLVAATLGSILAGLATPTEAAGMGAAGALVLAAAYGKLTWERFQRALMQSLATSSMVLMLALTANIFGAVFARLGAADWITQTLLALPVPPGVMLALVTVLVFLLGWPFEWPAVILVFLPIFYPVVSELGVDLVWFGALVAVTLQTAYLSPPVAMSAYYLKQVAKGWSLLTIYKGMFQFMGIQVVAIALIFAFPAIATWLPDYLFRSGALVVSEPPSASSETYGESYEQMYQRSVESLEQK